MPLFSFTKEQSVVTAAAHLSVVSWHQFCSGLPQYFAHTSNSVQTTACQGVSDANESWPTTSHLSPRPFPITTAIGTFLISMEVYILQWYYMEVYILDVFSLLIQVNLTHHFFNLRAPCCLPFFRSLQWLLSQLWLAAIKLQATQNRTSPILSTRHLWPLNSQVTLCGVALSSPTGSSVPDYIHLCINNASTFYSIGEGNTSKVPLQKYSKCCCFHDFGGVQFWWYNNINTRNTLQLIFSNFDCVESSKYVFDHLIKSWLTKLPTFSQYRWQTLLCCSLSLSESSHRRAKKKNTSHGNEVLPQETIHLMQRPCYQQRLCQDQAGNWMTWRPPDHCKEMQTAVVWSYLQFIRSGQNHLARHSERGKKTRQTEEEVGRQYQGMDRLGVGQVPEGSGEQGKMEKTSCEINCGAQMTLTVKPVLNWVNC